MRQKKFIPYSLALDAGTINKLDGICRDGRARSRSEAVRVMGEEWLRDRVALALALDKLSRVTETTGGDL